jgi:hypothetical protein
MGPQRVVQRTGAVDRHHRVGVTVEQQHRPRPEPFGAGERAFPERELAGAGRQVRPFGGDGPVGVAGRADDHGRPRVGHRRLQRDVAAHRVPDDPVAPAPQIPRHRRQIVDGADHRFGERHRELDAEQAR